MTSRPVNYAAYVNPEAAHGAMSGKRVTVPVLLMLVAGGFMATHLLARSSLDRLQQNVFDMAAPAIELVQRPLDAARAQLGALSEWAAVRHDNEALRAENEKLKEWYQAALMLQSENKALRELLNVDSEQAQKFVTTRVIADGSSTYAKSLVVEGGRGAGILKGQGVISHEGLLGRVIESGTRTARILLLQDINSRIPVLVEGSNARAILAGTNQSMPVLDHLAGDAKIAAGQRVITSGLGGLFPYGIPVGETVMQSDGHIAVALYAAPERTQHVQVVDYGIKPLLGDTSFSAASVESGADDAEPN